MSAFQKKYLMIFLIQLFLGLINVPFWPNMISLLASGMCFGFAIITFIQMMRGEI